MSYGSRDEMERTWKPEEVEIIEAKIEAARAGDIYQAISLLHRFIRCLEQEWPLPEPLRRYMVDAFREITRTSPSDLAAPVQSVAIKGKSDLKKLTAPVEETRDANVALNLEGRPGRKRSNARDLFESWWIDSEVRHEMESGESWENAVDAVAARVGVDPRTISRALKRFKSFSRHGKK